MYSKMLVTLDRSKTSETILKQIERVAGPQTQITLLIVAEVPSSLAINVRPLVVAGVPAPGGVVKTPGPRMAETRSQAINRVVDDETRYLEKMAKPLRERGLHIETHVAFGGDAGEQILKTAKDLGADVIVMATHGHGALAKAVFGSVTERVLRAGVCPVLLVRPDKLK
jgi:nucleotide-binding universal stress UspA family protein